MALRFPGRGVQKKREEIRLPFLVWKAKLTEPRQPLRRRFCLESGWTFRSRGAPPPRGREPEVSAGGEGEAGEDALLGAAPKMPLAQKTALQENGSVAHARDTRHPPLLQPLGCAGGEGLSSFQPELSSPLFPSRQATLRRGCLAAVGGLLNWPAKTGSSAAAPSPAGFLPCRRRRFLTSGA